jgi:hypothetical protein
MKINKRLRLYLDDIRTPVDEDWIVVRNYDEFVAQIKLHGLGNFEVISLDHDLGEGAMMEYYTNVKNNYILDYNNISERTGMDCCRYLVAESMNERIPLPQIYIHSANPIGSANMMGYINNYFKNCRSLQVCQQVKIEHTIDDSHMLSPEERKAKWDKSQEK